MGKYYNFLKINELLPWSIFPITVCIISWLHFYTTNSFEVDSSPIQPYYIRVVLFCILCFAYFFYYFKLYSILVSSTKEKPKLNIRKLSYFNLGISLVTLPLFSNDFFSLIAYADSFHNGFNIYTDFNACEQTEYASFINPIYQKLNCKYGPINMAFMLPSILWNHKSIFYSILITKLSLLFIGILYIEFALRLARRVANEYSYILLLCPIWFIQGIGQFHLDIIGVSFVLAGYFYCLQNKNMFGIFFLVLASLTKITYLFFVSIPFLLLLESQDRLNWKVYMRYCFLCAFYFFILGLFFYWPFIQTWRDVFAPITAMESERPSSTMADLSAYLMLLWNKDFVSNYTFSIKFFKFIGFAIMLFITAGYLNNSCKRFSHKIFLLGMFTVLILVFSHRFLPWYLMVMPLFLYQEGNKIWIQWFLMISFVSMFQDFAIFMHTDNIVGQVMMAFSTVFTVLLFFYKLIARHRYD